MTKTEKIKKIDKALDAYFCGQKTIGDLDNEIEDYFESHNTTKTDHFWCVFWAIIGWSVGFVAGVLV